MTCDDARDLLPEALSGGPDLRRPPGLDDHLAACAACRAEAEATRALLERLRGALAAAPDDVAPPALEAVLAAARARAPSPWPGRLARVAALLLAALAGAAAERALQRPPAPLVSAPPAAAPAPRVDDALRDLVAERPGGLAASLALLGALADE